MFGLKRRRRRKIRSRAFPDRWLAIIERNVAVFRRLPRGDQRELLGHVLVFLEEKAFEGCGGLEITDEVRVTIATQACLLLLHRETDYYPTLKTILVYPHHYVATHREQGPGGFVIEGDQARLGESWLRGPVVLSWDDVRRGASDPNDGHNVTFHEFAHQLDSEDGANEGAPALPRPAMYTAWARVMQAEFDHLRSDLAQHHQHFIDAYGATNPAEFFAVITEAFFEQPNQLKQRHPALYDQLARFYQQDPAAWTG